MSHSRSPMPHLAMRQTTGSWKPAQGREKSRWQLPQAVRGVHSGAELFPEKSSLVQRSMLGTSTGDFKRRKPRTKAAAIHNVLAQVASSKTKLPHWPRPVESRSAGTLPRAVKEEDMRRTPSHPVKLPSTSMPSPMASMAPSQPWQPSQPPPQPAAQQELTEPVKESAEPVPGANGRQGGKPENTETPQASLAQTTPVGKEGSNCDLPEPIKWRAGSLVPSVADCLDRYYADLVPAEDVQRMRVIFSRFANSNFEVAKEDLPEMLRRLCFFLVSGDQCNQIAKEATNFEALDFNDFQDFYERYAQYERRMMHVRLKRWRPNPSAREDADFPLQNIRTLLRSFSVVCTADAFNSIREVAGLKRHDCDHSIALIRFLAGYRSCEGFTVTELQRLTQAFHHCESDVVNLGPEGRLIRPSELARGLLHFGGLYCIDHLQALIDSQSHHFQEKTHGICFFEFLVNARLLRQMELSEVAGYFQNLDTDKDGYIWGQDLQDLCKPLGFSLLTAELNELQGDQGISADSQLSLDDAFNFIMHVREKNGFTAGERQEFLKTFDHFCKANREMPTLQVMELLDWQGFKNRVEDVRKMVQQVDFNENGTMDETEYLRLMRLQKEIKLSVYRKVYEQQELASKALTKEALSEALDEADLHVPPRLVEDTFLKCVAEQGQVSAGITWDTWVKAAEQSRKLIPVENRKQASFTDAELQQLRTAFDLQSSDGCVSKGQLLWMLADSGMPVNKASGRRDLYLSLDRARRKALEAGVAEEEVGRPRSPNIRFFPVVHLARAFLKNTQQKVLEREEAAMRAVRFSSAEVIELRSLFESEAQECVKEDLQERLEATERRQAKF
ncbi:unnamed protein product [Durusdinium trenchii]|uniref:EF-hand domain-containing protein n=1 Tax=Durusdinium trenchii TaxID=1381693 RepID=A0ABP0MJS1_9DINO